ncbi:hypothetical protein E1218_20170 [Kribbella turkmenica]|uniref:Uncharacterized protein n=1 Tax=Kribbella turkmenica TaxID=2530375 RepID=A0A4V2YF50_9ACTN|nr:hypothetical protein [Kribbella turkmenica]TDD21837.1 hypothetical protein E1218_20170 [Kribbella turkmenica]
MPDELLRPTIGTGVDLKVRPWRLMSQAYVAFFGGAIASTVITFLNARRLGVSAGRRGLILLTGVGGVAAVIAVFVLSGGDRDYPYGLRIAVRVIAVGCCLVQLHLQRPMDRAFQLRGGDYASLWGPGIGAVAGGIAADTLIEELVARSL